jgi:hypothetical protein
MHGMRWQGDTRIQARGKKVEYYAYVYVDFRTCVNTGLRIMKYIYMYTTPPSRKYTV